MLKGFMRLIAGALTVFVLAATAGAADFEMRMLNRGKDAMMVFEPGLLRIAPGDSVTFVAADMGHNAETIADMIPAGAEAFKGRIGETFKITFTIAGAYAVKCLPHAGMGMVALIVVGDAPANIGALKTVKLMKRARAWLDADIAATGC
jgi:pseudoazurin